MCTCSVLHQDASACNAARQSPACTVISRGERVWRAVVGGGWVTEVVSGRSSLAQTHTVVFGCGFLLVVVRRVAGVACCRWVGGSGRMCVLVPLWCHYGLHHTQKHEMRGWVSIDCLVSSRPPLPCMACVTLRWHQWIARCSMPCTRHVEVAPVDSKVQHDMHASL